MFLFGGGAVSLSEACGSSQGLLGGSQQPLGAPKGFWEVPRSLCKLPQAPGSLIEASDRFCSGSPKRSFAQPLRTLLTSEVSHKPPGLNESMPQSRLMFLTSEFLSRGRGCTLAQTIHFLSREMGVTVYHANTNDYIHISLELCYVM